MEDLYRFKIESKIKIKKLIKYDIIKLNNIKNFRNTRRFFIPIP
jgi:hypothetical protein